MQGYAREVATRLSDEIEKLGPFQLLTRGDELPVFAFKLDPAISNYTVFDVSNALRERGWLLPAYTFPANRTYLAALRVVVKRGFSHDLSDRLLADIKRQLPRLERQPEPVHTDEATAFPTEVNRRAAGSPTRAPPCHCRTCLRPRPLLIDPEPALPTRATTHQRRRLGIGWYSERRPAFFHSTEPARDDRDLRNWHGPRSLQRIFAHIRASTGTAIQQTDCHPFRHGRWLWMHNGAIRSSPALRRELTLAVDERRSPTARAPPTLSSSDLALTAGLEDDPPAAVARAGGLDRGGRHRARLAPRSSDRRDHGRRALWAFRYSSEGQSRSLFYPAVGRRTLKHQYPDNPAAARPLDESRLIVSEPLGDSWRAPGRGPGIELGVVRRGRD